MLTVVLYGIVLVAIAFPSAVSAHARLMEPPSRSSMWRVGFPTKKNFNDNALYCGGVQIQWGKNGGKCGICGDPWSMPHPRDNEAGGVYGSGIITRTYVSGQVIRVSVDVTTNHRGYFEFRLCPNNNPRKEATQSCLNKYLLRSKDGKGSRYYLRPDIRGEVTLYLRLPKGLTCTQCVFQWTYVAGNNWGTCSDGKGRLGCGPQETFRGCSDVAIRPSPYDRGAAEEWRSYPDSEVEDNDINKPYPDIGNHLSKRNNGNKIEVTLRHRNPITSAEFPDAKYRFVTAFNRWNRFSPKSQIVPISLRDDFDRLRRTEWGNGGVGEWDNGRVGEWDSLDSLLHNIHGIS